METLAAEKVVIKGLNTGELLTKFFEDCRARGLTPNTVRGYNDYLRHFAAENPTIPTSPEIIKKWLSARGESFSKRGDIFSRVQAFYKFLDRSGLLSPSPIPAAKMGRPRLPPKPKKPRGRPKNVDKVVGGGYERSQSPSPVLSPSAPAQYSWNPANYHTWDVACEFLGSFRSRGGSEQSHAKYKKCLSLFAEKYPNTIPMNLEAIEAFLSEFPPHADEHKHLYHAILRSFYFWIAKRKKYPPAQLEFREITPSRTKKVRKSLSNEQVVQLLQLDMSPRDRLIIEILLGTGVRVGELVDITSGSVQDGTLIVKGKTGERSIQISRDLELKLKAAAAPGQPLFVSTKRGTPLTRIGLYEVVRDLLARIGITDAKLGCHRLRHTYGRLYIENGGDLESLRQQLGHIQLTTTAIYSELAAVQVRKRALAADPLAHAQKQLSLDEALGVKDGEAEAAQGDQ